jgi:hypothetical protein
MKTFLDRFAAILGASSVALLLISVVYEWGYFFQVGRHLQSILTPADYLSNAILWLPYTVPATLIWVRAARLNNVTPPLERRDWFNWKAWIKPAGSWAFVLAVLVTTPWPPAPVAMFGLVVCAVIIWSRFWGWFYWPIRGIDEELQSLYRQAVQIVPPFLAGVFVWGSISG